MQGDKGSTPDQGTKIPYVAQPLSPRATTTEPVATMSAQVPQLRPKAAK